MIEVEKCLISDIPRELLELKDWDVGLVLAAAPVLQWDVYRITDGTDILAVFTGSPQTFYDVYFVDTFITNPNLDKLNVRVLRGLVGIMDEVVSRRARETGKRFIDFDTPHPAVYERFLPHKQWKEVATIVRTEA